MKFNFDSRTKKKNGHLNCATLRRMLLLFLLTLIAGSLSCLKSQAASHDHSRSREGQMVDDEICNCSEVVIEPETKIVATNSVGTIQITAVTPLERTYTWEGDSRSVKMIRRSYRWYGSCGLYFPGDGYHWKEHHGIRRAVLNEGQQHFDTADEATAWLKKQTIENAMVWRNDGDETTEWLKGRTNENAMVYRNDGLVVTFKKRLGRQELDVDVWQIYIANKKPSKLPGSDDSKIVVIHIDSSR